LTITEASRRPNEFSRLEPSVKLTFTWLVRRLKALAIPVATNCALAGLLTKLEALATAIVKLPVTVVAKAMPAGGVTVVVTAAIVVPPQRTEGVGEPPIGLPDGEPP